MLIFLCLIMGNSSYFVTFCLVCFHIVFLFGYEKTYWNFAYWNFFSVFFLLSVPCSLSFLLFFYFISIWCFNFTFLLLSYLQWNLCSYYLQMYALLLATGVTFGSTFLASFETCLGNRCDCTTRDRRRWSLIVYSHPLFWPLHFIDEWSDMCFTHRWSAMRVSDKDIGSDKGTPILIVFSGSEENYIDTVNYKCRWPAFSSLYNTKREALGSSNESIM